MTRFININWNLIFKISLMFKNVKNSALLVLLASLICACAVQNTASKKSDIQSVSYSKTLGRGGFLKIEATKDSLISTKFGTSFNGIPEVKTKIKPEDWNKIVAAIDLEMVKKTKSGEGRGHYDGPDEIFEIGASDGKYTLMNVADSTQYQQLRNLKEVVTKITASTK